MPKFNIKAYNAQKLADKKAKRAGKHEQGLHMNISRWQSSPLDLTEPQINNHSVDIPCTPVAPTTAAAAEAFETPAATPSEEGARELPPSADDDAEDGPGRPKRARKSSEIMNVSEFNQPTSSGRKKKRM